MGMAAVGLITGKAPGFAGRFADGDGELGDLFSHPRARQPAAAVRPAAPRRTTADGSEPTSRSGPFGLFGE